MVWYFHPSRHSLCSRLYQVPTRDSLRFHQIKIARSARRLELRWSVFSAGSAFLFHFRSYSFRLLESLQYSSLSRAED